jgi:hypothetical protein
LHKVCLQNFADNRKHWAGLIPQLIQTNVPDTVNNLKTSLKHKKTCCEAGKDSVEHDAKDNLHWSMCLRTKFFGSFIPCIMSPMDYSSPVSSVPSLVIFALLCNLNMQDNRMLRSEDTASGNECSVELATYWRCHIWSADERLSHLIWFRLGHIGQSSFM